MDDPNRMWLVSKSNNDFAYELHQILARNEGNMVFSPTSAHAILSLAHHGASDDIANSFENVLHLPKSHLDGYKSVIAELNSTESVSITTANKVFVKKEFKLKDSFKSISLDYFLSDVENIDFSQNVIAANKINAWVEDKTKGKIKDVVAARDLNDETALILVNAIYFKGDWRMKFKLSNTRSQLFHISKTTTVDCQMMHLPALQFYYIEKRILNTKILRIPYKSNDVTMVIFLPNKMNGIIDLEKKILNIDFSAIMNKMKTTIVKLSLPKFKVETVVELNEPLKELGLGVIFEDHATFPNMVDSTEPLKVSKVLQKAFINVDENGTEAAAPTQMEYSVGSSIPNSIQPITFRVDRPFLFAIAYRDHMLFHGKIVNPNI